jgi:O-antigen/teichoic acid export membrane protein
LVSQLVTPASSTSLSDVRERATRGVVALLGRSVIGAVLRIPLFGLLLRWSGPAEYGRYAASATIVALFLGVAGLGLDVALIRSPAAPAQRDEHATFTLLFLWSLLVTGVGLICCHLLTPVFSGELLGTLRLLMLTIPINTLWIPAFARLERAMDFRRLASVELLGELTFFGASLLGLHGGLGARALVLGAALQQGALFLTACVLSGFVPGFGIPGPIQHRAVRFGMPLMWAGWLTSTRELANPFLVSRFGTASDVGRVALAQRLGALLLIVRQPVTRVAGVSFAKLADQRTELLIAHRTVTHLQTAITAVTLGGFGLVSTTLLPMVLGESWAGTTPVFVLIGAGLLVQSLFVSHGTVMHLLGGGVSLVKVRGLQAVVTLGVALVAVPAYGAIGIGIAEVARSATNLWVHRAARRWFEPSYKPALPWLAVGLVWLAAPLLPSSVGVAFAMSGLIGMATLVYHERATWAGLLR